MDTKDYNKLIKVVDDLNKSDKLSRAIKTIDIKYDYGKIKGFKISY